MASQAIMTNSQEPLATGQAVRRFKDPAYVELATNLQTLRDEIDDLDRQIVALDGRQIFASSRCHAV